MFDRRTWALHDAVMQVAREAGLLVELDARVGQVDLAVGSRGHVVANVQPDSAMSPSGLPLSASKVRRRVMSAM
jgi:hypothetical protein